MFIPNNNYKDKIIRLNISYLYFYLACSCTKMPLCFLDVGICVLAKNNVAFFEILTKVFQLDCCCNFEHGLHTTF